MKKRLLIGVVASVLMTGCNYLNNWQTEEERKAAGIIELSYEIPDFALKKTEEQTGLGLAVRKCAPMGYTGAEPLGHPARTCSYQANTTAPCNIWTVTREYQCTGGAAGVKGK